MRRNEWSPSPECALRKLVKRKADGKTIEAPAEREDRGNVVDLMEALRNSVKGKKAAALQPRKSAPARKRPKHGRGRKAA